MIIAPQFTIYDTPDELAENFAFELKRLWEIEQQAPFHISLSGGSTPQLLFKKLAYIYREGFPFSHVHFWWGDERCVAPDGAESNYGVANSLFFEPTKVPKENIHRIIGENEPSKEAKSYSDLNMKLIPIKNGLPQYDIILLGMGTDGHTASIFPHQKEYLTEKALCAVATHPESGQKRITLTGSIIRNARQIVFLATGKNKARLIGELYNNKKTKHPEPFRYFGNQKNTLWFVDQEAASAL